MLGIASVKSSHDLAAARQRKLTLETRIQATQAEIDRLHNRIERLKSDPGMLERLAREDLGMVRPGDVVIELPSPQVPLSRAGEGTTAKAAVAPETIPTAPPAVPAVGPPAPESLAHP